MMWIKNPVDVGTLTLPVTFIDGSGNTKMIINVLGDILTNGVMGPLPK